MLWEERNSSELSTVKRDRSKPIHVEFSFLRVSRRKWKGTRENDILLKAFTSLYSRLPCDIWEILQRQF